MPLPLILGIAAGIAAAGGVGTGIHGAVKMKDANDTMDSAKWKQERAVKRFKETNDAVTKQMDALGVYELNIVKSFENFADLIEKIQGRPEFKEISKNGVTIPKYESEDLKNASVGAALLIGGLGGAAAGTAGGFAAAGVTTAAVMALGTASTGTAIASLSGAALTNATLAAIGGGAVAAGGGGMALGSTILGASTLGVGLLVGGVIFGITGSKLADKADEAYRQATRTENEVNELCEYLGKLDKYARDFKQSLCLVEKYYKESIRELKFIINSQHKTKWKDYTKAEKTTVQNAALLTGMLYEMCKVQLVLKDKNDNDKNIINVKDIVDAQMKADALIDELESA